MGEGWYRSEYAKIRHFGQGYAISYWEHKHFNYTLYGNTVNKQEIRDFLKIRDTDLYKAVYGN